MTKVLVVDDTIDMARLVATVVSDQADEVLLAHDGPRALELVAAERPDLVLLDVMMPGMSGLEVLRRLHADPLLNRIPVIMVTAHSETANIVQTMKEFSHPGQCVKQPTDLNRAIESTLTVSRNEWKYVAEIVTDFEEDLPPVPCLVGDFNQAILNLIVNAAQAISDATERRGSERGTITVRTRRDGDWVTISIADDGAGIPDEIRDKVFDHFFTTKEVGQGTGQGLSIARAVITQKHGGSLDFESQVGKGTTFHIRLPMDAPEEAPAPVAAGDEQVLQTAHV